LIRSHFKIQAFFHPQLTAGKTRELAQMNNYETQKRQVTSQILLLNWLYNITTTTTKTKQPQQKRKMQLYNNSSNNTTPEQPTTTNTTNTTTAEEKKPKTKTPPTQQ